MSQHYIHPNTSLTGFSNTGLMMCGISGVIEIPDDITEPIPGVHRESVPFRLYIQGQDKTAVFINDSLTWSITIDDAIANCSFSMYNYEPELYSSIILAVGYSNTTVWRGMIMSTSSSYTVGDEQDSTATYKYDIDCVSHEFMMSRKYISVGFNSGKKAGDIATEIYRKYIHNLSYSSGTSYTYENPVKYDNEDILSILQKQASISDCFFYIDPQTKGLVFKKTGGSSAPISLNYETSKTWDIVTNKWGFPRNNYHNSSVSKDGSNVATKVLIHGKKAVKHTITNYGQQYINDLESRSSSTLGEYFIITEGQSTFFTQKPIYCVDKIECEWIEYLPNLAAPWEDNLEKEHKKTWYNPMGSFHPVHLTGSNHVGGTDQWGKILSVSPSDLIDDEGNPIEDADAYYNKRSRGFWENLIDTEDPDDLWTKTMVPSYCSWEMRPELSNQSSYQPAIGAADADGMTPAFLFDVGYDSNTITFKAPVSFGEGEFELRFEKVKITYYEMVDETYTYTHSRKGHYSSISGTDGIFELHVEDDSIFESSVAKKYADRIFELHSIDDISASYSYYVRNLDILNSRLYPGMKQTIHFHGGQYQLVIDTITWNLLALDPLIFKIDVSLGTRKRDLSQLLADILK